MKRKFLVVAAVIIGSTLQAQNQTADKNLDEVIVTASRREQKQSQTGKVVTVIDQETLKNNPGKSLTEILNQYAGIHSVGANNNLGTNQELYMRGAGSNNTLFLLDGVPLQDASQINNTYDLNNINPEQIERIEILKGAQSTLWGSNAVAGVINIITKKGGDKKISPNISAAYGSYNTWRLGTGVNGNVKKLSYNLSYNRIQSDGFSTAHDSTGTNNFDKDGFTQNSFLMNLGYHFTSKLSANFTSNYGKYNTGIDAGAFDDDKDFTLNNKNFNNTLQLAYKTEKLSLHLSQSILESKRLLRDDSASTGQYNFWAKGDYYGRSLITDVYGNYSIKNHLSALAGLQYNAQKTDQNYEYLPLYGSPGLPLSSDSTHTKNFAAYASFMATNLNGFNIELGGRFNNHSQYGNNATFTFNPSYNINDATKVFVNISSGFVAPSLFQLYDDMYGNKNLQPEKSMNYELGVHAFTNDHKNSIRLVAFKRDIKNLIVYNGKYENRDEQHDYGFEVESSIAMGNIGRWANNFTYINGEGINNGNKLKNLFRRPDFSLNSTLTLMPCKNFTVVPAFRYVGERLKSPFDNGPNPMPHYYTVDIYSSYNIKSKIKLFADFRNITNQRYFDFYGYNTRRANFTVGMHASL